MYLLYVCFELSPVIFLRSFIYLKLRVTERASQDLNWNLYGMLASQAATEPFVPQCQLQSCDF